MYHSLTAGKRTFAFLCTLLLATFSCVSTAEEEQGFQTSIVGTAILGDGTLVNINYPLAFEEVNDIWYFRAGQQRVAISEPPRQYNMQFAVQPTDNMAYLAEFSDRYMRSFQVTVGKHVIELLPTSEAKYGLRLRIDNQYLLFDRRTPSLSIQLDKNGITGFRPDGFIRDLSIRRVE
ncbi:hypothetical protein CWE15_07010 [Aliidiomarina taiwanensis]|uniref:Uncharacterized protein n=1 Tax=Aliidiomarina taiwanensis TaxID=946228 RepID=A0A432X1S8_9GAMM|nr:hypothetical protein [Aliidiomarina taiwanensis]RUO40499.1 hypothetical protein CWE15_07010 [Aliidiomarina taiwanensis]